MDQWYSDAYYPRRQIHVIRKDVRVKLKDRISHYRKVQVGKDQEKAQSEKYYHSKNRGGKKTN